MYKSEKYRDTGYRNMDEGEEQEEREFAESIKDLRQEILEISKELNPHNEKMPEIVYISDVPYINHKIFLKMIRKRNGTIRKLSYKVKKYRELLKDIKGIKEMYDGKL